MAGERENQNWSREEHILAVNLYCKIPFAHGNSPSVRRVSLSIYSRTDGNAVARPRHANIRQLIANSRCTNGLCLNALHDRAFDRRLMWLEEGFIIRFSARLAELFGFSQE